MHKDVSVITGEIRHIGSLSVHAPRSLVPFFHSAGVTPFHQSTLLFSWGKCLTFSICLKFATWSGTISLLTFFAICRVLSVAKIIDHWNVISVIVLVTEVFRARNVHKKLGE